MVRYSEKEIIALITKEYCNKTIAITAPLVKSRKGHYRELFDQLIKQGYSKVYVNGEIINLTVGFRLDRYKTHDISLIVDRINVKEKNTTRLKQSVQLALKKGKGELQVVNNENTFRNFSKHLMCPSSGIALPTPEPNLFSFNSPKGACNTCNGLGYTNEIEIKKIIPNDKLSIHKGGIEPLGSFENNWIFKQISLLLQHHNYELKTPINKLSKECLNQVLYGTDQLVKILGDNGIHQVLNGFEGVGNFILRHHKEGGNKLKRWASKFLNKRKCENCSGARLKYHYQWYQIDQLHIGDIINKDISSYLIDQLYDKFGNNKIGSKDTIKEQKTE